jgi:hypothetical protein
MDSPNDCGIVSPFLAYFACCHDYILAVGSDTQTNGVSACERMTDPLSLYVFHQIAAGATRPRRIWEGV